MSQNQRLHFQANTILKALVHIGIKQNQGFQLTQILNGKIVIRKHEIR